MAKKKTRNQRKSKRHTKSEVSSGINHTCTGSITNPTISCCMIVKNEEAFLSQCLESVKGHVDEIIIVDTGSTDDTVRIAQRYTDKIYFHPWEGSFSKARNQALSYVTCDWVFQIDADEELIEGSGPKLRRTVQAAGEADAILVNIISTYSNGTRMARHNLERIFKNNGIVHYEGIVHNRIVGASCVKPSKIELIHYGYDLDEKKAWDKFIRTTELLKKQIEEDPNDPMPHHYLGTSYLSRSMHEDCIRESLTAMDLAQRQNNNHPLYLVSHYHAAVSFLSLGNLTKARYYSRQALEKFPEHLDSHFTLTVVAAHKQEWQKVLHYGKQYINLHTFYSKNPDKAGLVINATLKEAPTVHLLMGHAYYSVRDLTKMEQSYQKAYETADRTWELLWKIGTFHLDHSDDLDLAKSYLNSALKEAPNEPRIWYMLAKLNNKTGSHDEEKRCLEEFCRRDTTDITALNRLASLWIGGGDNVRAAEVFNTIIEKDSTNYHALCGLGKICKHEKNFEQAVDVFTKVAQLYPQNTDPWIHMGDISVELNRYDDGRVFFERAMALQPELITPMLSLCEIDLRQNKIVDFIRRCDQILVELELNRNRTIHTMEDVVNILLEIKYAVRERDDANGRLTTLLSLLPVDYNSVLRSFSTHPWQDMDTIKRDFFLKTVAGISQRGLEAS
ncbi:MAG TPA: glycosyltransferase [Deltaproteobacteria bacterium]|nr:glycosyltransferase [Deltaproteobacteria bacterium]